MTLSADSGPTGVVNALISKPGLKPELNGPPPRLKFMISVEAGRHCHRRFVVGCGIRFCSAAIAPAKVLDASSVSDRPCGRQGIGCEARCTSPAYLLGILQPVERPTEPPPVELHDLRAIALVIFHLEILAE